MNTTEVELRFDRGTIVLENSDGNSADVYSSVGMQWDERTRHWRAPAYAYRDVVLALRAQGVSYRDSARSYDVLKIGLVSDLVPRKHQKDAIEQWTLGGRRGVVQLPTGAGKTFLAILAIAETARPTLVIVPTIDLLHQWQGLLTSHFGQTIGALGGGERALHPITVATYDSAALLIDSLGPRFGLLVVDECHHLPAPQYRSVATASIAPFRLGLSATVARADGKESDIYSLLGPLVYDGKMDEMIETVLAPYDVVSIEVPLSDDEAARYKEARAIYTGFLRRYGVDFRRGGWIEFVKRAARLPGGRDAMRAYREQRRLAQASSAKLVELWRVLRAHRGEKVIIFTDDNEMAYRIGGDFVLPVLTHHTKLKERKRMLEAFRTGALDVIVTSKVLNEGVDVPDASVGVVISGSGGVREHVQRLGRILRHRPGKTAVLYELVSKGTSELYVNQRRKQHHAYQGTPALSD